MSCVDGHLCPPPASDSPFSSQLLRVQPHQGLHISNAMSKTFIFCAQGILLITILGPSVLSQMTGFLLPVRLRSIPVRIYTSRLYPSIDGHRSLHMWAVTHNPEVGKEGKERGSQTHQSHLCLWVLFHTPTSQTQV